MFNGIAGQGGTIDSAKMILLDYANFATTKDYGSSIQDVSKFKNLKKINNSYTQTLELGYKGLIAGKLSIQVDGYWSRISNYVSALRSASGAVMFDWQTYLGQKAPGGKLYDNLHQVGNFLDNEKMFSPNSIAFCQIINFSNLNFILMIIYDLEDGRLESGD